MEEIEYQTRRAIWTIDSHPLSRYRTEGNSKSLLILKSE